MQENIYSSIELPVAFTDKDLFKKFLGEVQAIKAFDDINFVTDRYVVVKTSGHLYRIGKRRMKATEVEFLANYIGRGANVASDVKGGEQLDDAYKFVYQETKSYRYRVNISALQNEYGQGLKLNMRAISTDIPTLEYVGLSQDEFELIFNGPGLVVLSGETGSGKTTTVAGGLGHLIRTSNERNDSRIISCYENPTEYLYQPLVENILEKDGACSIEVYQHEIPKDLPTFSEGMRNAFRSNPDIINLGEARDRVTIEASLQAALSGHLVLITTHAKGFLNTISRLITSLEESQRDVARVDFSTCLKMVISQELISTADGKGRVPLREKMVFTEDLRLRFAKCSPTELTKELTNAFEESGHSFLDDAKILLSKGTITKSQYKHIAVQK
jgi:defect-in-organelle-trafficking protein DotB